MEAISRSCLPEAAARTKRQRKATCCGVLGAASHRTTCSRSSAAKLTSGLILAMRTHISYWPQYVYLFMIHTNSSFCRPDCWHNRTTRRTREPGAPGRRDWGRAQSILRQRCAFRDRESREAGPANHATAILQDGNLAPDE